MYLLTKDLIHVIIYIQLERGGLMKNTTSVRMPKKYQGMIAEIYKDSEGYWAYSKSGHLFEGTGCHTAHEYSQSDLLAMIRTLGECDCKDCINI